MDEPIAGRVRVEPHGVEVPVREGETLFDAAWRLDLEWPTICYGQAQCTFCHVRVLEGAENTVPVSGDEEPVMIRRLSRRLYAGEEEGIRLACRMRVTGDVVVEQRDVTGAPRTQRK